MNKQQLQYYQHLINLGYTPKFYPEKNGFMIPGVYFKLCDSEPSDFIIHQAREASHKISVVLLRGNLTFTEYECFSDGGSCDAIITHADNKFSPLFYGEFDYEYFQKEAKSIADIILSEKGLVCKKCFRKNEFTVEKNLHFKATCVCGAFIGNIPTNKPAKIHFGKYAGREISSMTSKEEVDYLKWALANMTSLSKKLIEEINKHLSI